MSFKSSARTIQRTIKLIIIQLFLKRYQFYGLPVCRDFTINYFATHGEVLLRLREVKFTSGDVSFPAVATYSTAAKYFVWRSLHYMSISFHFHATFMIISLFSEVKFKDYVLSHRIQYLDIYYFVLRSKL